MKPWQKKEWCLAKVSGEFVWRMEDVLDLYAEEYDARRPVVCVDEHSFQLRDDVREPLGPAPGRPARQDSEYRRCGTCNLFVAFEPLAGRRLVKVTKQRCATDFAEFIAEVVAAYPEAETIRVVWDNLNTHTPASFYRAFDAETARRLTRKLEIHPTPKHGSWLNQVEIELSVLSRQCLSRRLPSRERVAVEVAAWQAARNAEKATVEWRFSTADARTKLGRLYDL